MMSLDKRTDLDLSGITIGLVCVGYTLGTGGITKLSQAGANSGLAALWPLLVGGFLFWTLLEATGRFGLVTSGTILHSLRVSVPAGRVIALLILTGVTLAQVTGIPVLVNLVAKLMLMALGLIIPSLPVAHEGAVLGVSVLLLTGVCLILWNGGIVRFGKIMLGLVGLMILGIFGSLMLVLSVPHHQVIAPELSLAEAPSDLHYLTLLGIALAAPTFLLRPLLLNKKGWITAHEKDQSRDARVAAFVLFGMTAAIVGTATLIVPDGYAMGSLFPLLDQMQLECGSFVTGVFLLGLLGAGLSSLLPMVMISPLLIEDYRHGGLRLRTKLFRGLTVLICVVGLTGHMFEGLLLAIHRLAGQVAQIVVLPLVTSGILLLLNRGDLMSTHKAGFWLNAGMVAACICTLWFSWSGIAALGRSFI